MNDLPLSNESELVPGKRSPAKSLKAPAVTAGQLVRQTARRVSPARDSGRPPERHDQRRQPKRGRHKDSLE